MPARPSGSMRRTPRPVALGLVALVSAAGLAAGPARAETLTPDHPRAASVGGPLLAARGVVQGAGTTRLPTTAQARAWLVADVGSGVVLAAKDAHARHRPASTLKALTALTLLPRLDPATTYRAVYADAAAEGSRVGIVPGGTYTVAQLFDGLMLPSGNDAAMALAHVAGGPAVTVRAMNAEARRLRALDTWVVNPSGLDADGQLTSAYDLALVARAGLARDDFTRLVSTKEAEFPGKPPKRGAKQTTFKIYNQNRMLQHGFPGAVGVKTGYTTFAGRTFIGAAERNGRLLVVTILGATGMTEPMAEDLLTWGFANVTRTSGVGQLVDPVDADTALPPVTVARAVPAPRPATTLVAGAGVLDPTRGLGLALVVAGALLGGVMLLRRRRALPGRASAPAPPPEPSRTSPRRTAPND